MPVDFVAPLVGNESPVVAAALAASAAFLVITSYRLPFLTISRPSPPNTALSFLNI